MDPAQRLAHTFHNLHLHDPNRATPISAPVAAMADNDAPQQEPQSSGVTPESLKEKLEREIGAVYVEVADLSGGCGQMFEAIIVSPQFTKKTTLARHRLVNGVLKDEIAAIHAWTPKCHTPEEWEKKKPQ